jgi:hypothetical protein
MDIKKFIKRICWFALPYLLYGIVVTVVDPYDYFAFSSVISTELKPIIARHYNFRLWKITRFSQQPCPNILLGDSRINRLDIDVIKKITGEEYFSFGYTGGTLQEIISTFWYAADNISLKNVYIGINFNKYNLYDSRNDIPATIAALNNPLFYFSSLDTLKSLYKLSTISFLGDSAELGKPPMTREEFWNYFISVRPYQFYRKYRYPKEQYNELLRIRDYCRQNDINLVFLVLPTHIDIQKGIDNFSLRKECIRFIRDLTSIAKTYHFDFDNEITRERSNFSDPNHFNNEISERIVQQVWGKSKGTGKVLHFRPQPLPPYHNPKT